MDMVNVLIGVGCFVAGAVFWHTSSVWWLRTVFRSNKTYMRQMLRDVPDIKLQRLEEAISDEKNYRAGRVGL